MCCVATISPQAHCTHTVTAVILEKLINVFFIRIIGFVLFLLTVLTLTVVEFSPKVTQQATEQLNQADTVNQLLKQVNEALGARDKRHQLFITKPQLESLVGVLQRAVPTVKGEVKLQPAHADLNLSFDLWHSGVFLNTSVRLLPGQALSFDYIRFGDLTLPGNSLLNVLEWMLNTWTKSDIATQARSRITQVALDEQQIFLQMEPIDQLLVQLNQVKDGLFSHSDSQLKQDTAYYLRYISGRELALFDTPQSLLAYLREGMARARERSQDSSATEQNKAVILALAIFVGHHRIANLVGDVQPDPNRALKPKMPAVLFERDDLAKHFIISAALRVIAQDGVSLAIGEFKELMDRADGGSGYSFVDLAADMAGVAFADSATDPKHASQLQSTIASSYDESVIMPSLDELVEGLSKREFERRFSQVDSPQYKAEVDKIRTRIQALSLYTRN